jgi:membrane-bound serine protease (ClpP class)
VLFGGGMALRAFRRPVVSGQEEMVGAQGHVQHVDASGAWAHIHGERWKVVSPDELAPGRRVRVVKMTGLTLEVRVIDDSTAKGPLP